MPSERKTFDEITLNANGFDFSGGKVYYACDKHNPKNYMEISSTIKSRNDRKFINTEFKVFNNGVQQKCDEFSHGKFTHYSRADGSNSSDYGVEHWNNIRDEMRKKGGFGDDMIVFSDLKSYQEFVETGKTVQDVTSKPTVVETETSVSSEEIFNNFIKESQSDLSRAIAKQQDLIDMLSARIDDIKAAQNKQTNAVSACKAVIDSNAYQKFNPILSSFSDILSKSAAKKDKKVADIEKKIKKIKKKIKKLERKQERTNRLKGFIDTVRNPDSGQSEFIEGMKALRQDSIFRAENQLEKLEGRISKAAAKLESGNLSNVDTVKLKAKVKKLESKRDQLVAKINNLHELDQELNKLAKIELVDDKVDEMKNTAVETAEKAAMNGKSVENIIDTEAETAADSIDNIISEIYSQEENITAKAEETNTDYKKSAVEAETEKSTKNKDDKPVPTEDKKNLGKKTGVTGKQALNILNAGIPIQAVKNSDSTLTIVFDKSKTDEINRIIENTKTQAKKR